MHNSTHRFSTVVLGLVLSHLCVAQTADVEPLATPETTEAQSSEPPPTAGGLDPLANETEMPSSVASAPTQSPFEYEPTEAIRKDNSVSFPVDI
jgi:hypothetical protein